MTNPPAGPDQGAIDAHYDSLINQINASSEAALKLLYDSRDALEKPFWQQLEGFGFEQGMRFENWAFGPGWQGLTAAISSAHEKYQAAFDSLNPESPQQADSADSEYGQKLLKLETDLQTEITVALERYSHRLQVCRLAIHDYLLWRTQADQEFDAQLERIEAQRSEGIAQIEAQRSKTWGEFGQQQPNVAT